MMLPSNYLSIGLACAALGSLAFPAVASPAVILDAVSFQAGPARSNDSLGTLAAGDRVEVIWCATDDGQCLVEIHNRKGWVPLALLNLKPGRKKSAADEFGGGGSSSGGSSGSTPGGRTSDPTQVDIAKGMNNNSSGPTYSIVPGIKF